MSGVALRQLGSGGQKGGLELGDRRGELRADRTVTGGHRLDQRRVGLRGGTDFAGYRVMSLGVTEQIVVINPQSHKPRLTTADIG